MTPRPVNRPRPIPFAAPAPASSSPRPVSWTSSASPLAQAAPAALHATLPTAQPASQSVSQAKVVVPMPARRSQVLVNGSGGHWAATGSSPSAKGKQAGSPTLELSAKFVGQGALSVRSSVTGRHYRFQGHGDCQKIDKHDLMMLKRIPDLIVS
ncbi:MAG: hypothetical protein EKK47_03380 [Burkholderiales bacterium]|jgi:hypothetical protein|nr:MAG: hypothetical protein EKK47_03380 [Burkholderiales bacterium]